MSLRTFIRRALGRPTYQPKRGNGRATDDWQSGDLAKCVRSGPWQRMCDGQLVDYGPRMCQILRVCAVTMTEGHHALAFHGLRDLWTAENFRKIRPNNRDACTITFKRQMKDCRPRVDA